MSYEAEAHQVQMAILKELLLVPAANFAKLQKATQLTSDHFTFHLNKLVDAKYVAKNPKGHYVLTRDGKEYANRMDTDNKVLEKQAKVAVVLIIEDSHGRFLAQQRLKQPYFGFWGRPTGKIKWGETVLEGAARELMEEAGITADLAVKGIYHKMDYSHTNDLLEDKVFFIVHGTNPRGELLASFDGGENHWLTNQEVLQKEKVFPKILEISELVHALPAGALEFIETKHQYSDEEY